MTLPEPDAFEICKVCFWQDDGQDDPRADEVFGGPNRLLSLTEARKNYRATGACETAFLQCVRKPFQHEIVPHGSESTG